MHLTGLIRRGIIIVVISDVVTVISVEPGPSNRTAWQQIGWDAEMLSS